MEIEIVETSVLPSHVAARLSMLLTQAVEARGGAALALSGGSGLRPMFEALLEEPTPWAQIHIFQVDERIAPDGHPDRNWTEARAELIERLPQQPAGIHPMPVAAAMEGEQPAATALDGYRRLLEEVAGRPAVLDVVHLGLGEDGHTASLLPDDPVLDIDDRDLAFSGPYNGRRRMTVTFPALARARHLVWMVMGSRKATVVGRLVRGDRSIPAGRVPHGEAALLVDREAAAALP